MPFVFLVTYQMNANFFLCFHDDALQKEMLLMSYAYFGVALPHYFTPLLEASLTSDYFFFSASQLEILTVYSILVVLEVSLYILLYQLLLARLSIHWHS